METSMYRRDEAVPAIHIDNRAPGYPLSSSARAINIPSTHRLGPEVPPPLPPPTHPITGPTHMEPAYSERNYYDGRMHGSSVSSVASSGYGSIDNSYSERPHYKARDMMNNADEGYASMSSNRPSLPSLAEGFGRFHEKYSLCTTDDYSTSIKDKLNSHIPTQRTGRPYSRSYDVPSPRPMPSRPHVNTSVALPALSLPNNIANGIPNRPMNPLDSPPSEHYQSSAVSPHSATTSFNFSHAAPSDYDRSPSQNSRVPSRHGYDSPMEDHEVHRPMYQDRAGSKRRASSPLEVDFAPPPAPAAPAQFEMMRRREGLPYRGSPTARLTTIPQGAVGSYPAYYDRPPPSNGYSAPMAGAMPPMSEPMGHMPALGYGTHDRSPSMNTSPRGSISRGPPPPQRNGSVASPRRINEIKADAPKVHTPFICDCCQKKPKRFETREELRAHESEKQYECQWCGNRFKNKNEAERHQNSLHVRRHSWSCKALDNYSKAFHENRSTNGKFDTCGYCGKDFERHGRPRDGGITPEANDQDWEERVRHLQTAHKFRECNSSKKFFRADHFRQHLKHSHSGTSGKWTNQLENACMRDEEPSPAR